MHSLARKIAVPTVAALLVLGAHGHALANDLSLPSYNWAQQAAIDNVLDQTDPTEQVLAAQAIDVWGRIRKGFAIPDLQNPLVASQTAWYAARPEYLQRSTNRASLYLFHVLQELEKRNMPTELALLPFIESAFNPQAYSSAKAAGMWQFIPSTGLDFKLKQNMFKDDRRDVVASTDAALTYLQKLYGMFGDWQLALAAYNWGEGSVQRAVNRNRAAGKATDFNTLSALMPLETRNYVPKLQAVKNIIANPEQYGIVLPKVDNQPYFVTIGKTRDIDIKLAAQLAELSIDEFKALNPQFNRPIITGNNTQILLPQTHAEKFKANLAKWGRALSSWSAHKVTSAREKIETIAARFGTTPAVLREVNHIPPRMHLKAGSTILVPKSEQASANDIATDIADNATMAVEPDAPPTRTIHVKVGKRDSLATIARRNHVSVAQLKTWNGLRQNQVAVGQSLQIQVPNRTVMASHDGKKMAHHARPAKVAKARAASPRGKTVVATSKTGKKRDI